jgi:hypothetical protein
MKILSLGAGVQSTAMALMAERGEIECPDYAIFADTGWEPKHVYTHLDWLEKQLSYPVLRVQHSDIKKDLTKGMNGERIPAIPFFIANSDGSAGIGMRQCTHDYKLIPIKRCVSKLVTGKGMKKKPGTVTMMIGISIDEISRMKPSRVKYIIHRWPLVDLRMSRNDCRAWMRGNGFPDPPRSACLGCPFHSNKEWLRIKNGDPEEWEETVRLDKLIRNKPGMKGKQYMHNSLKPLDEVDFDKDKNQIDLFDNECEGMCGL